MTHWNTDSIIKLLSDDWSINTHAPWFRPCSEHDDAGRGGGIPRIRHDARWYIFGQMGAWPDCPCHQ